MEECYCVKCKEKVEASGDIVLTKNNRNMFSGICPNCGTKVCRFMKGGSE